MKKLLLMAALVPAIWACKKDKKEDTAPADNVKPVVMEFKINEGYPSATAQAGDEMHVDVQATDDRGLSQVRINIHANFDGHSHRTSSTAFSYDTIINLSGSPRKEYDEHLDIDLPANVKAGPYHASVKVTDLAGNEAEPKYIDLVITSATAPVITITAPDLSKEIEVNAGGSFSLTGTATDDTGLDSIYIALVPEHDSYDHAHRLAGEEPIFEISQKISGTSYTIDQSVTISSNDKPGHYELVIKVLDIDGNMSIKKGEVHVEEAK